MTLVDSMGSLAVASKGRFQTGISTDINATFVKPGGKMGDSVSVLGEVVGMGTSSDTCYLISGKTLAYTRVELRDPKTNDVLGMWFTNESSLWKSYKIRQDGDRLKRQCGIR